MKKKKVEIKTINVLNLFVGLGGMLICVSLAIVGLVCISSCEHWSCAVVGYITAMFGLICVYLCWIWSSNNYYNEYEVYGKKVD